MKLCKYLKILFALGAISAWGFIFQQSALLHAQSENVQQSLFEKLPSSQTGITFKNQLKEKLDGKENLFDFDYFYNGAGLGIADINNDGLQDIFFAANQGKNALYLNKGNLTFEDISESAGINYRKKWSNGVAIADVNQDGFLDIYVSQGGPKGDPFNGYARRNLLYINQGDLTFKEEANNYGLADEGISTQSVFFDFDKDGDLDCFVGNESFLFSKPPLEFYGRLRQQPELITKTSCHLYRNDNGKFVDITEAAGVLKPSFALGVIVSDINDDGWMDIYVANDYFIPDFTFINQGDGTFVDENKERFAQQSFYGMGVDIADLNNDGAEEVFVLDMASSDHFRAKTLMRSMSVDNFRLLVNRFEFPHQYMFNSLQRNLGNGRFQNVGQFSGTSKTDWSWAGLISDFDHDGYKDIYVTNGYRRYALDNDFQGKVTAAKEKYNGNVPLFMKEQLYNEMPSEKLANYLFHNQRSLHFGNVAESWGLGDPSFSNGAAYADLDKDGDLELVVNNMDEEAFVYKNLAVENGKGNFLSVEAIGEHSESFAKVTLKYGGMTQMVETKRVRGYLSAMPNVAHFGIADQKRIDTLRVEWPSGKVEEKYKVKRNQFLTFYEKDAKSSDLKEEVLGQLFHKEDVDKWGLDFQHRENEYDDFATEILLPYSQSQIGPFLAKGDINGDGLEDVFVGGASGQSGQFFIQNENGFSAIFSPGLDADANFEDMEALIEDFDGDGDKDLFVVSGGNAFSDREAFYTDRLYWNDGTGAFERANNFPETAYSGKSVCSLDFDRDGDIDILVGNRILPQQYPKAAPAMIFRNDAGDFVEVGKEVAPELEKFGIINELIATDIDNDGWEDLIAVGEWTEIGVFKNDQGQFRYVSSASGLDQLKGWWFSVTETDVNGDGLKDYIVGNLGLNSKFKASAEKPFKVFANDFDANGTLDIVLSAKQGDEYLPVRGKECSSQQMPFISKKFPTYKEFALASLEDIYGDGLSTAESYEANTFSSLLLINQGDFSFKHIALPAGAQLFPIISGLSKDLNGDGKDDLVLTGNIYNTEVETPRLDGGSGLVLFSNGIDGYRPISTPLSGLFLTGDVKDLDYINVGGSQLLLSTSNDGPLQVHRLD